MHNLSSMLLTSLVVKLVLNVTFTRLILFIFRYVYIIDYTSCLVCKRIYKDSAVILLYALLYTGQGPWLLSQDPKARIRELPVDQS